MSFISVPPLFQVSEGEDVFDVVSLVDGSGFPRFSWAVTDMYVSFHRDWSTEYGDSPFDAAAVADVRREEAPGYFSQSLAFSDGLGDVLQVGAVSCSRDSCVSYLYHSRCGC